MEATHASWQSSSNGSQHKSLLAPMTAHSCLNSKPMQHQAPAAHLALPLRRARPFMRLPSAMNCRTPSCTPRVTGFCTVRGGSYFTQ